MTDEEKLAERYVNGIPMFAEEGEGFSRTQMQQAFLAGLEVGRPKWHKVADRDLPKEECGWVCNQDGLPCYFDWGTEQWLDCEGTQIRVTEWCNMPHTE